MMLPMLMIVPLILMMWWTSRSQKKKQEAMEQSLKVGDRVILQGGLTGKLVERGDKYIKVEIASGVKATFVRTAIVGLDTGDAATAEKATAPSK